MFFLVDAQIGFPSASGCARHHTTFPGPLGDDCPLPEGLIEGSWPALFEIAMTDSGHFRRDHPAGLNAGCLRAAPFNFIPFLL